VKVRLIAVGNRMERWVQQGFGEYQRRLPRSCSLELMELPLRKRRKNDDVNRLKSEEADKLLAAAGNCRIVALDEGGELFSSYRFAQSLGHWMAEGRNVALLVGGPDGLAKVVLERAEWCWSLSPLTLPHGLVRVLVAEQIYRAWSILAGHPYHRA
jgi:23S rRNA (pseudouridine1915-N3)-methyltransferase